MYKILLILFGIVIIVISIIICYNDILIYFAGKHLQPSITQIVITEMKPEEESTWEVFCFENPTEAQKYKKDGMTSIIVVDALVEWNRNYRIPISRVIFFDSLSKVVQKSIYRTDKGILFYESRRTMISLIIDPRKVTSEEILKEISNDFIIFYWAPGNQIIDRRTIENSVIDNLHRIPLRASKNTKIIVKI